MPAPSTPPRTQTLPRQPASHALAPTLELMWYAMLNHTQIVYPHDPAIIAAPVPHAVEGAITPDQHTIHAPATTPAAKKQQ